MTCNLILYSYRSHGSLFSLATWNSLRITPRVRDALLTTDVPDSPRITLDHWLNHNKLMSELISPFKDVTTQNGELQVITTTPELTDTPSNGNTTIVMRTRRRRRRVHMSVHDVVVLRRPSPLETDPLLAVQCSAVQPPTPTTTSTTTNLMAHGATTSTTTTSTAMTAAGHMKNLMGCIPGAAGDNHLVLQQASPTHT